MSKLCHLRSHLSAKSFYEQLLSNVHLADHDDRLLRIRNVQTNPSVSSIKHQKFRLRNCTKTIELNRIE